MRTACLVGLTLSLLGCAEEAKTDRSNPSAGGTGAIGGQASATSTGGSTSMSSGGSNGSGGSSDGGAGGGGCEPQQHLCGGSCVGNTPETGCSSSTTCEPCPAPPRGASGACTPEGQCDVACTPPYTSNGMACICEPPHECCGDAECGSGEICMLGMSGIGLTGQCEPCAKMYCALSCLTLSCLHGDCVDDHCECQC